jgi:predicted transcriptional regulator
MLTEISGLTVSQSKNVEKYLHLFADVEAALKKRLGRQVNDRTGINVLINEYVEKNPHWKISANQLRNLVDIRNLLTHQRCTTFGYPIAVAPSSLKVLCDIEDQLNRPEPVSGGYRRNVKTVSPHDSIASVLTLAFENGFSQFPAISQGRFSGLITENEITRWLGRGARARRVEVNLAAITVRMVLKEKDPFLKGIPIFHFERLDAPVDEVMGRFSAEPALEVILLTTNGNKDAPIEGIITQWDAARYQRFGSASNSPRLSRRQRRALSSK